MLTIAEGSAFSPIQHMDEGNNFFSFNEEILYAGSLFSNIRRQEKRSWRKSKIRYGVFDQETIPFLVFEIAGAMESIHTVQVSCPTAYNFDQFNDEILSFLLLCEFPSTQIKVLRSFKIKSHVLIHLIKRTIQAKEQFKDNFEMETKRVMSMYSNTDMVKGTSMNAGLASGHPNLKYFSYVHAA
ncbi:MAG: hypothetical protein HOC09_01870 [Deltaproteobacteria bacterium]|jgi:hypothetical protein|nr:hypothetical protein [Deltaproteobacteria bacterium]